MRARAEADQRRPLSAWMVGLAVATIVASYGVVVAVVASSTSASLSTIADFADSFAILATVLSAAAFVAIAWTLALQQRQLDELRAQGQRAAAIDSLNTNLDLVRLALDHRNLADVYGLAVEPRSASSQQIYAHMIMLHWWTLYAQEMWDDRALEAAMRTMMHRSEAFRFYWTRSKDRWESHDDHPGIAHGDDPTRREVFASIANSAYERSGDSPTGEVR